MKGDAKITELNRLIELIDAEMSQDLDVASFARGVGTNEYHL